MSAKFGSNERSDQEIAEEQPDEVEQVAFLDRDGLHRSGQDDLRVVDWRIVATGIAAWLDEHPREVDPVDFLEVVHALLDDD